MANAEGPSSKKGPSTVMEPAFEEVDPSALPTPAYLDPDALALIGPDHDLVPRRRRARCGT
jgi:hypothetical protein